jgi:uncharacterized protein with FMN-binding domain
MLRIVRRGTGSAVTWQRAKMMLLTAQSMDVTKIAGVTLTSADRVRALPQEWILPDPEGRRPRS